MKCLIKYRFCFSLQTGIIFRGVLHTGDKTLVTNWRGWIADGSVYASALQQAAWKEATWQFYFVYTLAPSDRSALFIVTLYVWLNAMQ